MPDTIRNLNEVVESGLEAIFQQSFYDFYPGIIYVYDANLGKLRFVNKKISEVLGFSDEDLSQWDNDMMKLIYPEDIDFLKKEINKYNDLKDEGSHSYPCRFNQKAGGWMHFEVTGKVLQRNPDGKPSLFLFMAQDVHGYVKAKEELKSINAQIKEREELLVDYNEQRDVKEEFLQCGSWKINLADKVITWSDGMYRLFGYDPKKDKANLVVDEDLYRSHIGEADFEKALQFRAMALQEANDYNREYEITTQAGEKKRIETFAKISRDVDGNPKWVVGTTHNITRLRNFEMEREENITKLKNSVTNLEDFTYIASHDIQEPLRKIATFSERLKAKYASDLNDEAKGYLERIMTTSKNAHVLIDGLMSFLQLDHQQQHFIKTDLNTLLDEVKEDLELQMDESTSTIISKNLPTLEVIPQQIKQLLNNLISNALKFRKPDRLLVIDIDAKKIKPVETQSTELNANTDYFEITINDNGVGFANESTRKMFQMFQRFHHKGTYLGSGIGLAICKKIIDKHNGLISAHGKPGEGATFSIVLPARQIKEDGIR